jgi:ORF6N domain
MKRRSTDRTSAYPISTDGIESHILLLRGQRVMLDSSLARLYGVDTKALKQAVRRNRSRFPSDFMFELSWEEVRGLELRIAVLRSLSPSRSQSVTLDRGRNMKYQPYVFTEQGVAMLSGILRSDRAVHVNIEIMRAFVRLRRILASNAELARKLEALEKRYDSQFKVVFDAIRQLMKPPDPPKKRPIGFAEWED